MNRVELIVHELDAALMHNVNVHSKDIVIETPGHVSCEATRVDMWGRADTITLKSPGHDDVTFRYVATKFGIDGGVDFWAYHCRINDKTFRLTVNDDRRRS